MENRFLMQAITFIQAFNCSIVRVGVVDKLHAVKHLLICTVTAESGPWCL